MAAVAARSCLRSATTSARSAAARFSAGAKPRTSTSTSTYRTSSQSPLNARVFKSPVEMRSISAVSMLPYHTATASALLTSMLSVSPRSHAWTLEGESKGRSRKLEEIVLV